MPGTNSKSGTLPSHKRLQEQGRIILGMSGSFLRYHANNNNSSGSNKNNYVNVVKGDAAKLTPKNVKTNGAVIGVESNEGATPPKKGDDSPTRECHSLPPHFRSKGAFLRKLNYNSHVYHLPSTLPPPSTLPLPPPPPPPPPPPRTNVDRRFHPIEHAPLQTIPSQTVPSFSAPSNGVSLRKAENVNVNLGQNSFSSKNAETPTTGDSLSGRVFQFPPPPDHTLQRAVRGDSTPFSMTGRLPSDSSNILSVSSEEKSPPLTPSEHVKTWKPARSKSISSAGSFARRHARKPGADSINGVDFIAASDATPSRRDEESKLNLILAKLTKLDTLETLFLSVDERLKSFEYEMRETIKMVEYHAELSDVTDQVMQYATRAQTENDDVRRSLETISRQNEILYGRLNDISAKVEQLVEQESSYTDKEAGGVSCLDDEVFFNSENPDRNAVKVSAAGEKVCLEAIVEDETDDIVKQNQPQPKSQHPEPQACAEPQPLQTMVQQFHIQPQLRNNLVENKNINENNTSNERNIERNKSNANKINPKPEVKKSKTGFSFLSSAKNKEKKEKWENWVHKSEDEENNGTTDRAEKNKEIDAIPRENKSSVIGTGTGADSNKRFESERNDEPRALGGQAPQRPGEIRLNSSAAAAADDAAAFPEVPEKQKPGEDERSEGEGEEGKVGEVGATCSSSSSSSSPQVEAKMGETMEDKRGKGQPFTGTEFGANSARTTTTTPTKKEILPRLPATEPRVVLRQNRGRESETAGSAALVKHRSVPDLVVMSSSAATGDLAILERSLLGADEAVAAKKRNSMISLPSGATPVEPSPLVEEKPVVKKKKRTSWFENFRKRRADKKKELDERIADIVATSDRKEMLREGLKLYKTQVGLETFVEEDLDVKLMSVRKLGSQSKTPSPTSLRPETSFLGARRSPPLPPPHQPPLPPQLPLPQSSSPITQSQPQQPAQGKDIPPPPPPIDYMVDEDEIFATPSTDLNDSKEAFFTPPTHSSTVLGSSSSKGFSMGGSPGISVIARPPANFELSVEVSECPISCFTSDDAFHAIVQVPSVEDRFAVIVDEAGTSDGAASSRQGSPNGNSNLVVHSMIVQDLHEADPLVQIHSAKPVFIENLESGVESGNESDGPSLQALARKLMGARGTSKSVAVAATANCGGAGGATRPADAESLFSLEDEVFEAPEETMARAKATAARLTALTLKEVDVGGREGTVETTADDVISVDSGQSSHDPLSGSSCTPKKAAVVKRDSNASAASAASAASSSFKAVSLTSDDGVAVLEATPEKPRAEENRFLNATAPASTMFGLSDKDSPFDGHRTTISLKSSAIGDLTNFRIASCTKSAPHFDHNYSKRQLIANNNNNNDDKSTNSNNDEKLNHASKTLIVVGDPTSVAAASQSRIPVLKKSTSLPSSSMQLLVKGFRRRAWPLAPIPPVFTPASPRTRIECDAFFESLVAEDGKQRPLLV